MAHICMCVHVHTCDVMFCVLNVVTKLQYVGFCYTVSKHSLHFGDPLLDFEQPDRLSSKAYCYALHIYVRTYHDHQQLISS